MAQGGCAQVLPFGKLPALQESIGLRQLYWVSFQLVTFTSGKRIQECVQRKRSMHAGGTGALNGAKTETVLRMGGDEARAARDITALVELKLGCAAKGFKLIPNA